MIIKQVDSFTEVPFRGNPAGVCVLEAFPEEDLMQDIAAEMNLAETAFVVPRTGGSGYDLRWFTPVAEVDLCGHATLASAHVLFETGRSNPSETIAFETKSGLLSVGRSDNAMLVMDFPSEPPEEIAEPPGLAEALGASIKYVGANRMDVLVEVEGEDTVRSLAPNISALEAVEARGVIVTAARFRGDTAATAGPEGTIAATAGPQGTIAATAGSPGAAAATARAGTADFVSRFFAPRFGVPEDPVTGSAHCCLAPYWAGRTGKLKMLGYQASRRGGYVWVEMKGDRVLLGGNAVTVFTAELNV